MMGSTHGQLQGFELLKVVLGLEQDFEIRAIEPGIAIPHIAIPSKLLERMLRQRSQQYLNKQVRRLVRLGRPELVIVGVGISYAPVIERKGPDLLEPHVQGIGHGPNPPQAGGVQVQADVSI